MINFTETEKQLLQVLKTLVREKYNIDLDKVLSNNPHLAEELMDFKNLMAEVTLKVLLAAIKRKTENKPSMSEQNYYEHIAHLETHLDYWFEGEAGDEGTVVEQAAHTLCRAMLAYYTYVCVAPNT